MSSRVLLAVVEAMSSTKGMGSVITAPAPHPATSCGSSGRRGEGEERGGGGVGREWMKGRTQQVRRQPPHPPTPHIPHMSSPHMSFSPLRSRLIKNQCSGSAQLSDAPGKHAPTQHAHFVEGLHNQLKAEGIEGQEVGGEQSKERNCTPQPSIRISLKVCTLV